MGTKKTYGDVPRCPNHGCRLDIPKADLMKGRGSHPCVISGALFDWSVDTEDVVESIDINGNKIKSKKITVAGEDS